MQGAIRALPRRFGYCGSSRWLSSQGGGGGGGGGGSIVVVGASVMDMIAYVPRLPALGETLLGTDFQTGFGGKGANQAVAAAKLGGACHMVTKLGADSFGRDTLENFRAHGVGVKHVLSSDAGGAPTGVAPISVDANGDNSIVVVMGANGELTEAEVEAARPAIREAALLVVQLEVPLALSMVAMRVAREEGVATVLNTAPAQADLPDALLALADIVCPNQTEAALLTGLPAGTAAEAEAAAHAISLRLGGTAGRHVIVTLGGDGALWLDCAAGVAEHVAGTADKPRDTVGAGDCFMGAFAYFVAAEGAPFREAIRKANVVAGNSVTKPGTQISYPSRDELPAELFDSAAA